MLGTEPHYYAAPSSKNIFSLLSLALLLSSDTPSPITWCCSCLRKKRDFHQTITSSDNNNNNNKGTFLRGISGILPFTVKPTYSVSTQAVRWRTKTQWQIHGFNTISYLVWLTESLAM